MKKDAYPLNALDKFILMHESSEISYNSQVAIAFSGEILTDDFYKAILEAIKQIPLLRTKTTENFWNFKRVVLKNLIFSKSELIDIRHFPLTSEELDQFCHHKFDLSKGYNFKFLIAPTLEGKQQIIFNIHHSLCDAAGQFLLLEEIFRLMNGKEVRPEAKLNTAFRYRELLNRFGFKWVLSKIWKNHQSLSKQRNYKMASFVENPNESSRLVTSLTYHFTKEESAIMRENFLHAQLSLNEFVATKSFEAADLVLSKIGDKTTPIMAYLPKTLRPQLKLRYSYSNVLSTVVIVGKRSEINNLKFAEKIKKYIHGHKIEEASAFIFKALLPCSIGRSSSLKKYFANLDNDTNSSTSSMLISTGKLPRSFELPKEFENVAVWARGTMLKSPGVGIIMTGTHNSESLTIEYLKGLTSEQTAMMLYETLINKLTAKKALEDTFLINEISKNDCLSVPLAN